MASVVPDKVKTRYDRSERLWGSEGQKLLMAGHAVLLGATACGSELLKNLVLPGLGKFTVVDGKTVTKRDLGNNFFLRAEALGKNRAEALHPNLAELNPLVTGAAVAKDIAAYVEEDLKAAIADGLSLVVASGDVKRPLLLKLAAVLEEAHVPLMFAKTTGLVGTLRLQAGELHILHTLPDAATKIHDLRPLAPFPELQAFFDRYPLGSTDVSDFDRDHTPWFCVLHHAVKEWAAAKGDPARTPQTMPEWKEVKVVIQRHTVDRTDDEGRTVRKLPDSYNDAVDNCTVRTDLTKRYLPELQAIVNDKRAAAPTAADGTFWFLAHALRAFREEAGRMPIAGRLPDFTATTAMYRELQGIFKAQAAKDAATIAVKARAAATAAGFDVAAITDEAASEFSAQAWEAEVVTYPTIAAEAARPIDPATSTNSDEPAFLWYAVHQAALVFEEREGKAPGDVATVAELALPTEPVVEKLWAILKELWPAAPEAMKAREVAEWVRFGGGEPAPVAAVVGAVGAQECIKVIQNRRAPMTHTTVFDGIRNCFTVIGDAPQ